MSTIFVDPDFRGKGYGRLIVEALENDPYGKRAEKIYVHSAIPALPFYKKLGYDHKNGKLNFGEGWFELEKEIK